MSSYRLAFPPLAFALAITLGGPAARAQSDVTFDDSESRFASPGTAAPNRLANPEFVSDLAGWGKLSSPDREFAWAANDVGGDPRSGAARLTYNSPGAGGAEIYQCFPASPGKTYVVGGSAWLTSAFAGAEGDAILRFYSTANCAGLVIGGYADRAKVAGSWKPVAATGLAPAGAMSVGAYFGAWKVLSMPGIPPSLTVYFDKLYFREGKCAGTVASLCLNGERFRVQALWKKADGSTGYGGTVPFTADSGSFWFFDPSNVELNVKVLDACSFNGRYWVFASGGTNVEVTLTVTDTQTGAVKTYKNPQGQLFATIADVNAFATCP